MDGLGGGVVVFGFLFLLWVGFLIREGRSWQQWGWFHAKKDKES